MILDAQIRPRYDQLRGDAEDIKFDFRILIYSRDNFLFGRYFAAIRLNSTRFERLPVVDDLAGLGRR